MGTNDGQAAAFEAARTEANALLDGLTDDQVNWRPAPDRWSIAQNLEHLIVTGRLYGTRLGAAAAAAPRPATVPPYRPGWLARIFIRSAEPQQGIRFRAPRLYEPHPTLSLAEVRPAFDGLQTRFIELVRSAAEVDANRVRVTSPAVKLVRLSLGEWIDFLAAHQRRHLWQARQVRQHPDFPGR